MATTTTTMTISSAKSAKPLTSSSLEFQMDYTKILYSEIAFKPAITNNNTMSNGNSNHVNSNNGSTNLNNNDNNSSNHDSNKNNNNNNNQSKINTSASKCLEEFKEPTISLCDPNSIKLNWSSSEKVGGGLINVGNTCFLNSVLQCLTYCTPLYNFLCKLNGGHSVNCKLNQFCMLCEMEKHIKRIKNSNGGAIKPISIVQRLKYINRSFQFGRQEDAHEFLRYIIDHMWKACLSNLDINSSQSKLDPRIKETTIINQIFGGYHRSQVLCLSCNCRSNTFDFFMDIILDIRNAKSLEEGLKKFTQQETLENENAYKCSKCRRKVKARKKFTIYKAPNVATFQLKRFDSDRIFGGKITKFISYPEEFDLRPYMSDPTKGAILYQLSAVLVHVGHSSNSGHYFCFIKNSNNLWYRMDDSNVSVVSQNTVLQQQGAYVLFYTKKSGELKQSNPSNGIATWCGSTSKLEENGKKDEFNERDRFNDELDRGKIKKIKRMREDNFPTHSKTNPFQDFSSNGFKQQFSQLGHRWAHHDSHKNWFRHNGKHKGLNMNRRINNK